MLPLSRLFVLTVALVLSGWLSPEVCAHRLNVFAYPEGDEMKIESYFSRGGECMNCAVQVLDAAGSIIASGTTDENGRWSFRPAGRAATTIAVIAGEGHRGEYTLLEEDLPDSMADDPKPHTVEASEKSEGPQPPSQSAGAPNLSASDVEAIVDKVLERKLGPLRRELNKALVDEPGLQDIVTGIGYIFGLFGVAAYFLSRSNRKS